MRSISFCLMIGLFVTLADASAARAQVTFGSLVDEIIDRDRLAVHPSAGVAYEALQSSSHNPNPTVLGAPANFSNPDRNYFSGSALVDGQLEYTMLEASGPGVITRWWMTSRDNLGDVKVYIDGNPVAVMSGTFRDVLGGQTQMGEELSFQTRSSYQSGYNLYASIPYSESIKIAYRGPISQSLYYNINYRKYEAVEMVQSYVATDPTTHATQIQQTNSQLQTPSVIGHVDNQHSQNSTLAAGQTISYDLSGTGAIRRLQIQLSVSDHVAALRNTYVELVFDGQTTARVPAGQFFGNGDGSASAPYNTFEDLYRTVAGDGTMTSRWVMPYQTSAQVRLVNQGTQSVNVALEVDSGNWTWNEGSMHFHANYIEENGIKTRPSNGTADFRYLTVRGQGVYVGDTLSLQNRVTSTSTLPWWGEGDEKVYIDYIDSNGIGHNAQPDHFGTGTEDYYGYAWGHSETFDSGFISQPIADGNDASGRTVNSRVRALDAIPFDNSFKFDMEVWHWQETNVDYGATTYWYGRPGASAMRVAADLANDYQQGHDFSTGGVPDSAGDGQWLYLCSSDANPSGDGVQTDYLSYGTVGRLGHQGYGGGQNNANLAAISDEYLFADAGENIGIQGSPGYHELTLHPAGTIFTGSFIGEAEMPFAVARWIAGASSDGLANISGSVRNFVDGYDSVDFYIYVNGELKFTAEGIVDTMPESYFDFDVMLEKGSTVDFVLGNGGVGNLYADESFLRAIIMVPEYQPVPEPSTIALLASVLLTIGLAFAGRKNV
ncbi:MAG: DUF2961 domain-containing protein [Pirellulales bacterium]|nr:DUF2961 domain-containing protein [Pirellulales bacterium]